MYRHTSVSSRGYGSSRSLFTRITWPLQAPSDSEMPSKHPPFLQKAPMKEEIYHHPTSQHLGGLRTVYTKGARPRGQRKTSWYLSVYYQFSLSNFHREVTLFAVIVLCNCNTASSVCPWDCIFFQFVQKWRSSTQWALDSEAPTIRRIWGQILAWWLGELTRWPEEGSVISS